MRWKTTATLLLGLVALLFVADMALAEFFYCPYCNKPHKNKIGLAIHKPICPQRLKEFNDAKEEWKEKKEEQAPNYSCPYCDKGFDYKASMEAHKLVCSKRPSSDEGASSAESIVCQGCKKTFKSSFGLKLHQKFCKAYKALQNEDESEDAGEETAGPKKKFVCPGCKESFGGLFATLRFAGHVKKCPAYAKWIEENGGDEPSAQGFVCDGCGETFSDTQSYTEHVADCKAFAAWQDAAQEAEDEDAATSGNALPPKDAPNGGFPADMPTNICGSCGRRYPTRAADAAAYGVLPWAKHKELCDGTGDGISNLSGDAVDADPSQGPVISFGGVPTPGSPAPGATVDADGNGGDSGGGSIPGASAVDAQPGDGADGAVHWAIHVGPSAQNEKNPDVAPPNCWDDWCLKYVAYAWIFGGGRQDPLIGGAMASDSMRSFIGAGRMRAVKGPIPKGAPVFWDHGKVGHIAIATGETDSNGDPLIVSTWVGGSQHGVFVKPLSWFTQYVGTPKGWGVMK